MRYGNLEFKIFTSEGEDWYVAAVKEFKKAPKVLYEGHEKSYAYEAILRELGYDLPSVEERNMDLGTYSPAEEDFSMPSAEKSLAEADYYDYDKYLSCVERLGPDGLESAAKEVLETTKQRLKGRLKCEKKGISDSYYTEAVERIEKAYKLKGMDGFYKEFMRAVSFMRSSIMWE